MRDSWIQPWDPRTDSAEIGWAPIDHDVHRAKLEFVADLRLALGRARAAIPDRAGTTWLDGLPARRARRDRRPRCARPTRRAGGRTPSSATCRDVFPRDAIATVDTGSHRILLSQVWQCYEPYGLLQSTGLATMGYGLPAAIGAKLGAARPPRRVLHRRRRPRDDDRRAGDAARPRTAAHDRLLRRPLARADRAEAAAHGSRQSRRRFPATDLVAVARAYGGHGVRVTDRTALAAACRAALASDRFTLIEAVVDKAEYAGQM